MIVLAPPGIAAWIAPAFAGGGVAPAGLRWGRWRDRGQHGAGVLAAGDEVEVELVLAAEGLFQQPARADAHGGEEEPFAVPVLQQDMEAAVFHGQHPLGQFQALAAHAELDAVRPPVAGAGIDVALAAVLGAPAVEVDNNYSVALRFGGAVNGTARGRHIGGLPRDVQPQLPHCAERRRAVAPDGLDGYHMAKVAPAAGAGLVPMSWASSSS